MPLRLKKDPPMDPPVGLWLDIHHILTPEIYQNETVRLKTPTNGRTDHLMTQQMGEQII